jgi:hypothetical protein
MNTHNGNHGDVSAALQQTTSIPKEQDEQRWIPAPGDSTYVASAETRARIAVIKPMCLWEMD